MSGYLKSVIELSEFVINPTDFSIEFFFTYGIPQNSKIMELGNGLLVLSLSNNLTLSLSSNTIVSTPAPVSLNDSHYVKVVQSDGVLYFFVDGNQYPFPNTNPSTIYIGTTFTLGADINGNNGFTGEIGDFKILSGNMDLSPNMITIDPIDDYTATQDYSILIDGGNFIDSSKYPKPEELLNCHPSDSMMIRVTEVNESNTVVGMFLGWMPSATLAPNPYYSFVYTSPSTMVPWMSVDNAGTTVLVNGIPLASDAWQVYLGKISFRTPPPQNASVQIILSNTPQYFMISPDSQTTLTANLMYGDNQIEVENSSAFSTGPYSYAVIEGEVIAFRQNNTANNTLMGLSRNISGTSYANYAAGTVIYSLDNSLNLTTLTNQNCGVNDIYGNGSNLVTAGTAAADAILSAWSTK